MQIHTDSSMTLCTCIHGKYIDRQCLTLNLAIIHYPSAYTTHKIITYYQLGSRMQKSLLPLLISATVCGTLLAQESSDSDSSLPSAKSPPYSSTQLSAWSAANEGLTVAVRMLTLDNDNTTANNKTTVEVGYGNSVPYIRGFSYAVSASHVIYNEDLDAQNALSGTVYYELPTGGATSPTIYTSYSTADEFVNAGSTQNATMGLMYGMSVADLWIEFGAATGRTVTDHGSNTDMVGVNSLTYNQGGLSLTYRTGDLTFNTNYTRTNTSDPVGAESTDSVDTMSASVRFPVASGVTAILGYADNMTENGVQTSEGSTWYIGANMAF